MKLLDRYKALIPGLDSYRGRYAYFAVLVGIALITFSYLGWNLVRTTASTQITNISSRIQTAGILADVQSELNLIENQTQRVLIEPDQNNLDSLNGVLRDLDDSLGELEKAMSQVRWIQTDNLAALNRDRQTLHEKIEQLIAIRRDVQDWFPAMKLMLEEMYPHNQGLLGDLQILFLEVDTDLTDQEKIQVVSDLAYLQRLWFGMTGELRLMVANRFGLFSTQDEIEPQSRYENVLELAQRFVLRLREMQRHFEDENPNFIMSEVLREMEVNYVGWMESFKQVREFFKRSSWRMDLQFMQQHVTPVFERMHQHLASIDLALETQSAEDITHLSRTAHQLSLSILVMVTLGMIMLLLAYQFIERNLLRPIAQTAQALKQEASGNSDNRPHMVRGNLRETQDLIDAFSEMRRKVHSRESHLDHLVHHDALTQLPNRILFRDRLEHALAIAMRGDVLVGLMFIDLDRFKQVNDSLGHLVGDELLKIIAARLTSMMRSSDTVARLSGDEFAILIEGISSREALEPLAGKILNAISEPMEIAGNELRISASIGIAVAPFDDVSVEYLLRDADTAMYEAKRQGRAGYRFFTGKMDTHSPATLRYQNEIRHAVEADQFVFHFQPVVDTDSGRLFCYEALLRWEHPERGILEPEHFLGVLNETGLINTLFSPMLEGALRFQKQQSAETGQNVAVAVNLSGRLLNEQSFCRGLLQSMVSGEIPPGSLILEVKEEILTEKYPEAKVFLQQARTLGARIALDDFGTGHTSLSHLRQFPFDLLKIDCDFIRNVSVDSNDASLVTAMIQLAHAFRIEVVAEGVETEDQRAFLNLQQCDYVQGYLIGVPGHAQDQVLTRQDPH
ncbi:MAG: EAL domain-containing protein [Candidatus Thiodiazotropha sp.]